MFYQFAVFMMGSGDILFRRMVLLDDRFHRKNLSFSRNVQCCIFFIYKFVKISFDITWLSKKACNFEGI
jgi:hypothetical protein